MKRRLFNIFTVLSLLLFVATCLLWAESRYRDRQLWNSSEAGATDFAISRGGRLFLMRQMSVPARSGEWEADTSNFGDVTLVARKLQLVYPVFAANPQPSNHFLGFEWADRHITFNKSHIAFNKIGFPLPVPIAVTQRVLTVPYWLPALLTLFAPVGSLISFFRRRRHRQRLLTGRCPGCGYDVRASKDRCPECGTPIQTANRNGGNA